MTDPKAATLCIWCERIIASDAEFEREHPDSCDDDQNCWCLAYCWTGGGTDYGGCEHSDETPGGVVRRLRAELASGSTSGSDQ